MTLDLTLPPTSDGIVRAAGLSPDGVYRYSLLRVWDEVDPLMVWVLLNPSTADAERDDPTTKKCMTFARREGAGGIVIVNPYAYRATMPKDLLLAADPIGPDNPRVLRSWMTNRHVAWIVCGWGAWPAKNAHRCENGTVLVEEIAADRGLTLSCLGTNNDGSPRHPLYLPDDTRLRAWTP